MAGARIIDNDVSFFRGMNSAGDPGQTDLGYYWVGINVLNTGGVVSTRPGYRCIVRFPDGNLQGARIFRPRLGLEQLVVVVDGIVYVADFPFKVYRRLENVLFSPIAKQIFFANTVQSARRISEDFDSAIELVDPPRNVLFMQDGGTTAPAYYDGSESGHIRDRFFETPIGGPMFWIGDRLWVANGPFVYASDIGNPFSFREQQYLGGTAAFVFDRDVTAMAATPSIEFQQLLVFTEFNTSILQADIRERSRWITTDGFQREIFQIGCLSQRSVVNHFSRLSWWSAAGFTMFDAAQISKIQSQMPLRDSEMTYSKELIGEDQSLIAGGAYGQFTVMSVPAEDCHNKHTWVLNNGALASLDRDSGLSWAGYWIGTRPVEWIYGVIAGTERIYHVSHDEDEGNRLWLSWTPDRLDNGCPITWQVITRGYMGPTARLKQPGVDCTFCYADIALVCIDEDLDIGTWYAGGLRGAFKKVLTKLLHVSRGNLRHDRVYAMQDQWLAYKPQSRLLRTEDIRLQDVSVETGSCPPERNQLEDLDESFQLSITGQGPATIRWIRAFAQPEPEDMSASGTACEDEMGVNGVRFDGFGSHADSIAEVEAALEREPVEAYQSNQTAVVSQKGFSEVGVGHADSIISQSTADRVAECRAIHDAEFKLARIVPCTLSLGTCP